MTKKLGLFFLFFLPLQLMTGCKENSNNEETWSKDDVYTFDYSQRIDIDEDDDFVILNFADQQIFSLKSMNENAITMQTMDKLIKEVKPDLITCSGDMSASTLMISEYYRLFISFFDSYEIPWAPVLGNHDRNSGYDLNKIADMLEASPYCLFKRGPSNVYGVGNYSINVFKGDILYQSIILLDSGDFTNPNCNIDNDDFQYDNRLDIFPMYESKASKSGYYKIGTEYDYIDNSQLEWYEWLIKGIKSENNNQDFESTLIFHIPLMEFYYAYREWAINDYDPDMGQGIMRECVCCSSKNSGLFDLVKQLGSTKNIIASHDHINAYSIKYEGVTLTYGLKTGDGSYNDDDMNGGTSITYTSSGSTVRYHYIND